MLCIDNKNVKGKVFLCLISYTSRHDTHLQLVLSSRECGLYNHFPIRLNGVVLN
jgi:hypothetical protein